MGTQEAGTMEISIPEEVAADRNRHPYVQKPPGLMCREPSHDSRLEL